MLYFPSKSTLLVSVTVIIRLLAEELLQPAIAASVVSMYAPPVAGPLSSKISVPRHMVGSIPSSTSKFVCVRGVVEIKLA